MSRDKIANKLVSSVFVTLFFAGLSSVYIAHAVEDSDLAAAAGNSPVVLVNTTSKAGNIAASTFFTAGAVLGLLVVIMLALQLKKAS